MLLAGVGHAFYAAGVGGSGTGGAAPEATRTVALAVAGTVSTALYPGGAGGSVTVTVTNPYDTPLAVSAVSAGTPVVSGCANAALTVAQPASGLPFTVPANDTASATLAGVVTMGITADGSCQGATVVVPLRVTGRA